VWVYGRSSTATTATAATTLVSATTSTLSRTVTTTGTSEPATQASLSFAVAGTVTGVSASVGQPVAQVVVLATLDPPDLQSAVDVANTLVAADQQQVATAATGTTAAQSSAASAATSAEVVVISTASWIVDATVSGSDLAEVKPGLQVQVTPTGAGAPVSSQPVTTGIVSGPLTQITAGLSDDGLGGAGGGRGGGGAGRGRHPAHRVGRSRPCSPNLKVFRDFRQILNRHGA
jgi:multidrug resistance efflux pump